MCEICSVRKLQDTCREHIDFIWPQGNHMPDSFSFWDIFPGALSLFCNFRLDRSFRHLCHGMVHHGGLGKTELLVAASAICGRTPPPSSNAGLHSWSTLPTNTTHGPQGVIGRMEPRGRHVFLCGWWPTGVCQRERGSGVTRLDQSRCQKAVCASVCLPRRKRCCAPLPHVGAKHPGPLGSPLPVHDSW